MDLTTNDNGFENISTQFGATSQTFDLGFDCVYEDRVNGGLSATPNIYETKEGDIEKQTFNMLILYTALFNLNHKFELKFRKDIWQNSLVGFDAGAGDWAQSYLAFPNERDMGQLRREISSYDSSESGDSNAKNVLKTNEQVFKVKDYLDFNSEVVNENILSVSNGQATVKRITKYSWKVKEVFKTDDPSYSNGTDTAGALRAFHSVRYGPSFDGVNYEYIKYEGEKVSKGLLVNNVRQIPTGQFGHNLGGGEKYLAYFYGLRKIANDEYNINTLGDLSYANNSTLNPGITTITYTRSIDNGPNYGGHEFDNLTFPMSGLANPNINYKSYYTVAPKQPINENINYHFKNLMSDGYFKSYRDLTNPHMSGLFNPSDNGGSENRTEIREDDPIAIYYREWTSFTNPVDFSQNLFSINYKIGNWGSIFGGSLGADPSYANKYFNGGSLYSSAQDPKFRNYIPGDPNQKYLSTFRNHQSFINENNFDDYYKVEIVKVSESQYNGGTDPFSAALTKDDFEYKETNLFKGIYLSGLEVRDDAGPPTTMPNNTQPFWTVTFTPIFNQTYSSFSHRSQFHKRPTSWGNELDGNSYFEADGDAFNSKRFEGFENR